MCPEFRRIQSIVETAREELRRREFESNPAEDAAFASWERVIRTSLFSAEIDAAFHKARCAKCKDRAASITESNLLAEAA